MSESKNYWLVGAAYGGTDDQTERFVKEGIWEHGFKDKYTDMVNSIQVEERIAIKARFNRKNNLPFDNNGKYISCMYIKAVGVVTKNFNDGHKLQVKWEKSFTPPREWFFYTFFKTIWKLEKGIYWKKNGLIDFVFNNKKQDVGKFLRSFFQINEDFPWIPYYEKMATALLKYKDDRTDLIKFIHGLELKGLKDEFSDGTEGPLKDICPFTVMALFSKHFNDEKRIEIFNQLANFLGSKKIKGQISFDGVPVLTNMKGWLFDFEKERKAEDIDILWNVFEQAIKYADSDKSNSTSFIEAFNKAKNVRQAKWNLTMGFYWIRPQEYLTLDGNSREYLKKELKIKIPLFKYFSGEKYISLMDEINDNFQEEDFPAHSFPELSHAARKYTSGEQSPQTEEPPYSAQKIIDEGCFIEEAELKRILDRLKQKKNIILQGAPGTGKTWLAKRLAYTLLGYEDKDKVTAMQFHPTMSYEDFVQGYRPNSEGKLDLEKGAFLKAINDAQSDADSEYIFVIEEINRGNPAQIFGEMLTLLEPDKRDKSYALSLAYQDEEVWIPDNFYVIGTMNLADRSLAMLDFALRRRFAFIDLEPQINEKWLEWMKDENKNADEATLLKIRERINALNDTLEKDENLGAQYKIGHSFVTSSNIGDIKKWFRDVVETEIYPLLREYWFEDSDKAKKEKDNLLQDL